MPSWNIIVVIDRPNKHDRVLRANVAPFTMDLDAALTEFSDFSAKLQSYQTNAQGRRLPALELYDHGPGNEAARVVFVPASVLQTSIVVAELVEKTT